MNTTRLLLRWGAWMCYTEWSEDQPHEDWSGSLSAEGGKLHEPHLVMYYGCFGPQRRVLVPLRVPQWKSVTDFDRPLYGYKGVEGLVVDVEGDDKTLLRFHSGVIDVEFRLGDIPAGDRLVWPVGSKYSCSQMIACRLADDGVYWNPQRAAQWQEQTGLRRLELGLAQFTGTIVPRDIHHHLAAWVGPGASIEAPFEWDSHGTVLATWRFTGAGALGIGEGVESQIHGESPIIDIVTRIDGRQLSTGHYKAKHMRGASSALEHTDELGELTPGRHVLGIVNQSAGRDILVAYGLTIRQAPANWKEARKYLPFTADWFDGTRPKGDLTADVPSGGRGVIVGYDTNMMAAENGWIDSAIAFVSATGGGNYILYRTESDAVSREDWTRLFTSCRDNGIYFGINTSMAIPSTVMTGTVLSVDEVLALATKVGGKYFLGRKSHEVSLPMYSGWTDSHADPNTTLSQAVQGYMDSVRRSYARTVDRQTRAEVPSAANVPRLLGEAALAHRYDYQAGVDLILSETMTGHTSLLLAEGRGAAKAYKKPFWGMHIACHVHASPEDWRSERMFWLNLYLGYLSGASLLEDEEGGLAKVHSTVSGPTDPLPQMRQKTLAEFYRWAVARPRREKLQVDIGWLYGRYEFLTGGMSLNRKRPVRVWESFAPDKPQWEYGRPEYSWLLLDILMPGVWLCPVLQDPAKLRRWFVGTPHGQVDIVPIEADAQCLSSYKTLVLAGWHTMQEDDMKRLRQFVEQGGTLVLGVPQLQTSDDRTAVLSSSDWKLVRPELVESLCGLRVKGPGRTCKGGRALGRSWRLNGDKAPGAPDGGGPLRLADVELCGAKADLTIDKHPLVVRHDLGKGRVYTFTAWEYIGHRGLLPLARVWMERLVTQTPADIKLEGGDGEVTYFVYGQGTRRKVYLINTDWTVPGNVKKCTVTCSGGKTVSVEVREGQVSEVEL